MPREKRDDIAVKIAAKLYRKAKLIAADRGIPIAELLSELLEKPLDREFERFKQNIGNPRPE